MPRTGLGFIRVPLVLVLLAAPLLAPSAMGLSRAAEAPYNLATGVASNVEPDCETQVTVVNGVCFPLYPGERSVALTVRDASERNIAVRYAFHDGDRVLSTGHFCHSSAILQAPKDARTLVLVMGEPGKIDDTPLPGCQLQRGVGGVVSAVFR